MDRSATSSPSPAADMRRRLRLSPGQRLVLILPPIARGAGAFEAVWGGLLAHQVRRETRILLADAGREADRLCGLAEAVRELDVLRVRPPELPLEQATAEADVVVSAASPIDTPAPGLLVALANASKIVLLDRPVLRRAAEGARAAVLWVQHRTPREMARQIVAALDVP